MPTLQATPEKGIIVFDSFDFIPTLQGEYRLAPPGLRVRRYRVPLVVGYSNFVREIVGSGLNIRFDRANILRADLLFASDKQAQAIRQRWLSGQFRIEPIVNALEADLTFATKWELSCLRLL